AAYGINVVGWELSNEPYVMQDGQPMWNDTNHHFWASAGDYLTKMKSIAADITAGYGDVSGGPAVPLIAIYANGTNGGVHDSQGWNDGINAWINTPGNTVFWNAVVYHDYPAQAKVDPGTVAGFQEWMNNENGNLINNLAYPEGLDTYDGGRTIK